MGRDSSGIQAWLTAFREAALEMAATSLRFDGTVQPMPDSSLCGPQPSAYIPILSREESIRLGISTSPDGVRLLTRAMLRIRADRPIEDADAADGMGEILNIVAGKVKSRMTQGDGTLLLGLPMFISARSHAGANLEHVEADIRLGPVPCRLTVHRRCLAESQAA